MEEDVLRQVGYDLSFVTRQHFLEVYLHRFMNDPLCWHLATVSAIVKRFN